MKEVEADLQECAENRLTSIPDHVILTLFILPQYCGDWLERFDVTN